MKKINIRQLAALHECGLLPGYLVYDWEFLHQHEHGIPTSRVDVNSSIGESLKYRRDNLIWIRTTLTLSLACLVFALLTLSAHWKGHVTIWGSELIFDFFGFSLIGAISLLAAMICSISLTGRIHSTFMDDLNNLLSNIPELTVKELMTSPKEWLCGKADGSLRIRAKHLDRVGKELRGTDPLSEKAANLREIEEAIRNDFGNAHTAFRKFNLVSAKWDMYFPSIVKPIDSAETTLTDPPSTEQIGSAGENLFGG